MYDIDKKNRLWELINKTALAGVNMQNSLGAMPAGKNGPHNHVMTPARNTGHWCITFLHAYQITQDNIFKEAAVKGLNYLLSNDLHPFKSAFWHRNHSGKNPYNGLIGQSWSIEALYYGWKILNYDHYYKIANNVFNQHYFDFELGLWHNLDLDGSKMQIELTLNQQIWFAAMGSIHIRSRFFSITFFKELTFPKVVCCH